MIVEQLIELLAEHVGKDKSEITLETTFESLGIDSLDTVDLVMSLEEKLGVELELEKKLNTVGEMADFVQSKVDAQ